jgi:hypothetical protein
MRSLSLLSAVIATQAFAFDGKINIDYTASFLGLTVANGTVRASFSDDDYTSNVNASSGGIGKMFSGGSMSVKTAGTLTSTRLQTSNFALSYRAKENGSVNYSVSGGRVTGLTILPEKDPNPSIVKITDAHLRGVIDPSSATVLVVSGNAPLLSAASCSKVQPVFDGRLRYNLSFSYVGTEPVETNGYSGQAIKCRVQMNMIAGYRTDKPIAKDNERVPVYAWLVPVANSRMMVPYKIEVQTKFGRGTMIATKMEIGHK